MADFAPPTGPPPPHVPEGWKAVWNDQYKEWFYVNLHTKASQWDKPTEPVYASPSGGPPSGPPPGYDPSQSRQTGPEKGGFGTNSPYGGSASNLSEDEKLARKLQAEEDAKARAGGSADRGAADSYYQGAQQGQGQYGQAPAYGQGSAYGQSSSPYGQQRPPGSSDGSQAKGGFFSKLTNKLGGGSSSRPPQPGYGQTGQYGPGYGQYQGPPPQQQYYGAPQGQYYQQQAVAPQRKTGGLGAGGGALLGAGAGLVGGALLMDAFEDHEQFEEQQAYDQGYDNGGGGDDYGDDGGDGGDF